MNWYEIVFELIDMRSFSNLWFWIALAVVWSSASHWVLGVPYDMVMRASEESEGEAVDDLERSGADQREPDAVYRAGCRGCWLAGFACFVLTVLALTGFVYGMEFAQAVFLLGLPHVAGWAAVDLRPRGGSGPRRPTGELLLQAAEPAPAVHAGDRHGVDLRHGDLGHVSEPERRAFWWLTVQAQPQ